MRDNETQEAVVEYVESSPSYYPYQKARKRLRVSLDQLKTVRFTERFDMHNGPIYEGDVIEEHNPLTGEHWIGLVKWNKDKGQFIEEVTGTPFASLRHSTISRLGNIWEDPTLAKKIEDQTLTKHD
ncbi:hypothetical protein MUP65_00630 [Patescibacteria group bacterium]|nr:hypothetical protein [Patescibacteria group bacterium]